MTPIQTVNQAATPTNGQRWAELGAALDELRAYRAKLHGQVQDGLAAKVSLEHAQRLREELLGALPDAHPLAAPGALHQARRVLGDAVLAADGIADQVEELERHRQSLRARLEHVALRPVGTGGDDGAVETQALERAIAGVERDIERAKDRHRAARAQREPLADDLRQLSESFLQSGLTHLMLLGFDFGPLERRVAVGEAARQVLANVERQIEEKIRQAVRP